MEAVNFITNEFGDDLIVCFAIAGDDSGDVVSLMLLRTPMYEFILEPHERGVKVSHEDVPESERDMLETILWRGTTVRITTSAGRKYKLDVRRVDDDEVQEAKRILREMNADHAFKMKLGQ
jgi:hypothetical protein